MFLKLRSLYSDDFLHLHYNKSLADTACEDHNGLYSGSDGTIDSTLCSVLIGCRVQILPPVEGIKPNICIISGFTSFTEVMIEVIPVEVKSVRGHLIRHILHTGPAFM